MPAGRAARASVVVRGARLDGRAALEAAGGAYAGVEEAKVVHDLGDRAHGGAGFLETVFCSMEMAGLRPAI